MIDVEKMSLRMKLLAENAETIFLIAKDKIEQSKKAAGFGSADFESSDEVESSGSKKNGKKNKSLDLQQVVAIAEQLISEYVEPIIGDYIKKHVDFRSEIKVKVKTWPHFKGNIPQYESAGASGLDVRAQLDKPLTIKPFERVLVPTGLSLEVPQEYEIQARPRSGLSLKKGLTLVNTPGTIDADYRGEIKMIMINLGQEDVVIEDQERIAQLVICPVVKAQFQFTDDLSDTERGEAGFGSTGSH